MDGREPRALVVDDHPDIRSIMTRLLPRVGLVVAAEAESGEEAVAWCDEHEVDVVIMDAQMPGMGGVEATRVICSAHPEVHVFGFTAWVEVEGDRMREAGAREVFEKTDVGGLLAAVEAATATPAEG
jgi:CheY-like chemotaxis protein